MIVAKAVKMAEMMNIPVLGIVENMSYIKCPDCGHELARVILGGGTNQTKSCAGCGSRFRIIKDARTGSVRVEHA